MGSPQALASKSHSLWEFCRQKNKVTKVLLIRASSNSNARAWHGRWKWIRTCFCVVSLWTVNVRSRDWCGLINFTWIITKCLRIIKLKQHQLQSVFYTLYPKPITSHLDIKYNAMYVYRILKDSRYFGWVSFLILQGKCKWLVTVCCIIVREKINIYPGSHIWFLKIKILKKLSYPSSRESFKDLSFSVTWIQNWGEKTNLIPDPAPANQRAAWL